MKRYTYKDVNKALKNVLGYMYSIEDTWNKGRNLKLYEAFFAADTIVEKYPLVSENENANELFYQFCEDTYNYTFMQDIENGYIKDLRDYVGRTSTFYITSLHRCNGNKACLLDELFNAVCFSTGIDLNADGTMSPLTWSDYFTEEELIEDYQEDMEYIVTKLIFDVKKYMNDAIKLAEYIDTFKKRQVSDFEEFISNENDNIEYQIEQEEKSRIENLIQTGCEVIAYSI